MTKEDILKALSNVQEPDLGKDLVTLNMIKDIIIDGDMFLLPLFLLHQHAL
jgi:ATP-binding protein involved in chromosome partitioning